MTERVTIWYDKSATDPERPWLVKRGDAVTRAAEIEFIEPDSGRRVAVTAFKSDGFLDLQPGGPRGVIVCDEVFAVDEVSL